VRLHVIDGTYELFRAHYSARPEHEDRHGRPNKATYGVVASLLALLHDASEDVTHIAVAFDNPIRSFRNDLFAGYKTEEGMDPILAAQMDAVEVAVRAIGVAVWSMKEHEADDALATAAARFGDQVDQVRLMTPDKDLGQCLRGQRVVQVDRKKGEVIDEDGLVRLRGIGPGSIPSFLALVGDAADGIPGIPGFGEKTAAALLAAHGTLEGIPRDVEAWGAKVRGAPRLSATLRERWDDALLYRKLATLVTDAPISATLDEVRYRGVPREAFRAWCEEAASTALSSRPARWQDDAGS